MYSPNDVSYPTIHSNDDLKIACQNGLIECVKKNNIPFNYNFGLYGSCLSGNLELINLCIERGADDYNWALRGICEGGTMEYVKIIEQFARSFPSSVNYDWALAGACKSNNIDVVKYLLSLNRVTNMNTALRISLEEGFEGLFDELLSKCTGKIDYPLLFASVYAGINRIPTYPYELYGKIFTLFNEHLQDFYKDSNNPSLNCLIYEMSKVGDEEALEKLYSILEFKPDEHIIRGATLGGHTKILEKYMKPSLINLGYYEASYSGKIPILLWYRLSFDKELSQQAYITGRCQGKRNIDTEHNMTCLWCKNIH